jgi:hypothetical protein
MRGNRLKRLAVLYLLLQLCNKEGTRGGGKPDFAGDFRRYLLQQNP